MFITAQYQSPFRSVRANLRSWFDLDGGNPALADTYHTSVNILDLFLSKSCQ